MLAVLEHKESGRTNLLRMRLAARTGAADWNIEKRYVKVLAQTGAMDAALHELRHSLQTGWYRAESWQLLGEIAAQSGREAEARAAFARAEQYDVRLNDPAGKL
jgi:predicted negative regulator of RcsB-dependent stress response